MKKLLLLLACLFGPALFAQTPTPAPAAPDLHEDPVLHSQAFNAMPMNPALPTIWLIGDSTVHNGTGTGSDLLWGWGAPFEYYFDRTRINVVNRAMGGTSSRSFYTSLWSKVLDNVKKGDFVIMQFGANDNGSPVTGKTSIKGIGDETQDVNGETVHTFGWYMTQYIKETRDKGATPIICSLTPRNRFQPDGHFLRDNTTHAAWAAQTAKDTNTLYIDLYELIARKSEQLGKDAVAAYYGPPATEYLHTNWLGAVSNAECVVGALKAMKDDPLANYFSERGKRIPAMDVSQPPLPVKAPAAAAAASTSTK
ncbi:MAG TPA: rhamnogalacturonan acetylesterase [Opitutales bacterium]|jgi:lysophospholipase L1-like esterase|nr:rhamnogalacturonan acetylesterase [Opitutales bacterium]